MITIYTDGACSGNPGKGGWGLIIIKNNNIYEYYGGKDQTTNNRMEMTAVIEGLNKYKKEDKLVYTDSKYIINGVNKWLPKWKNNDWKTSSNKNIKNKDLWLKLDNLLTIGSIKFYFVKGHSGNIYNERADKLAKYGIEYH